MKNISKKTILHNRDSINKSFDVDGLTFIKSSEIDILEDYLTEKLGKLDIEISVDVSFDEPIHFKTLTYTKYAGSIIVYPLSQDASSSLMSTTG